MDALLQCRASWRSLEVQPCPECNSLCLIDLWFELPISTEPFVACAYTDPKEAPRMHRRGSRGGRVAGDGMRVTEQGLVLGQGTT